MTKTATESELGALHGKVAKVMHRALDHVEQAQEAYENIDGEVNPEQKAIPPEIPVSLLSVVTKFLAENKITCAPEAGNHMGDLQKQLADKQNRQRKAVGNVTHLFENE